MKRFQLNDIWAAIIGLNGARPLTLCSDFLFIGQWSQFHPTRASHGNQNCRAFNGNQGNKQTEWHAPPVFMVLGLIQHLLNKQPVLQVKQKTLPATDLNPRLWVTFSSCLFRQTILSLHTNFGLHILKFMQIVFLELFDSSASPGVPQQDELMNSSCPNLHFNGANLKLCYLSGAFTRVAAS